MNIEGLELIAREVSKHSIWFPLGFGFFTFLKNNFSPNHSLILILVIASLFSDYLADYLAGLGKSNMLVINVYQLIETFLLIFFFYKIFIKSVVFKIAAYTAFFFTLVNLLFISSFLLFDTTGFLIKSFYFIVCCLLYFFKIYNDEKNIFIEKNSEFWFVIGVLFYFSGAFFTFLTYEMLRTWMLHNLANSIKNILFAVGFALPIKLRVVE